MAIGAAVLIAYFQGHAARKQRIDEVRERLESMWTVIDHCRTRVAAVCEYALHAPALAAAKRLDDALVIAMRESIELVSVLQPTMAPTATAAVALIRARTAIKNAVPAIPEPGVVYFAEFEAELAVLRDALQSAADELHGDAASRK